MLYGCYIHEKDHTENALCDWCVFNGGKSWDWRGGGGGGLHLNASRLSIIAVFVYFIIMFEPFLCAWTTFF